MKTLQMRSCPPPTPSPDEVNRIGRTIEGFLSQIETARNERVNKILNYRARFRDDFKDRVKPNTIFEKSNISVPVLKGTCTSLAAKFDDEIWNADVPFTARPQNIEDRAIVDHWQKYWEWELLNQICIQEPGSQESDIIAVEGTCITKRCWKTDRSYFSTEEEHLHGPDGLPIIGKNGPITKDTFATVPVPRTIMGIPYAYDEHVADENGQPMMPMTPGMKFQPVTVKDSVVRYDNAELVIVPYEDFFCLETVSNIDDSPILGHAYEKKLWELFEMVNTNPDGWLQDQLLQTFNQACEGTEETVQQVQPRDKNLTATGALTPITRLGEQASAFSSFLSSDKRYKTAKLMEVYMKYDMDGDNLMEDVVCIYDRNTKKPVWIDYLVNVYADCHHPFTAHGLINVTNRWFSMGMFEFMDLAQEYVDKVFNRMSLRQAMAANPATWKKPNKFIREPPEWSPGATYELKEEANAQDSLGFYVMPAMENMEWQFFQFFIQIIQLVTGVTTAAQGDISTLPSTSTATGVASIIEEGNKLFRRMIAKRKRSLKRELMGLVRLIQQNIKQDRVFRYSKGLQDIIATVTPQQIREMEFDVDIVLTRYVGKLHMDALQTALQVAQAFIGLPPEYQLRMRGLFIRLFQASGIVEADEILPSPEEIKQDQDKDQALEQVKQKIQSAAAQIASQNLDPTKAVAKDLIGVSMMLTQLIARPPEAAGGAAPDQMGQLAGSQQVSNQIPVSGQLVDQNIAASPVSAMP